MKRAAPRFSLPDQDGVTRSLDDYRGSWLVVYFYPSDKALNCTREACSFRDEYRIIAQFGNAKIVGINKGSIDAHKKFSERHHLNFPILSDEGHKVTSAYGAWRRGPAKLYDLPYGTRRNTYLIDPDGSIAKEYFNVDVADHVQEIIADLQSLQTSHASA